MEKLKIYLDTSVIGGCFDEEFAAYSNRLIQEIKKGIQKGVISEITIKEIKNAPKNVNELFKKIFDSLEIIKTNNEIFDLAEKYIQAEILSQKYVEDALHIAIATVHQIDILVSWNFKHIVNYNRIRAFNAENRKNGYKRIEIYSPMEVVNFEEN